MQSVKEADNDSASRIDELRQTSIHRLLWKYTLPAIAGMIIHALSLLIDSVFIGQWIGGGGLAGFTIAYPLSNIIFAFGTLVGIGASALSSIYLGENKKEDVFSVLGHAVVLSLLFAVIIGGFGAAFLTPILYLFGATENVLPYAYDFMFISLLGLPITYIFFNLNHTMRATGYPKKSMVSLLITVVTNILFSILFIYVFKWGMFGAGLAIIVSQAFGLVWIGKHFFTPIHVVYFKKNIFAIKTKIVAEIFAIGLSPFLMNFCGCVVVAVFNHQLLKYGGELGISAYGILIRVLMLLALVELGIAQGFQPIVGYNHGAQLPKRVKETLKYALFYGTLVSSLGSLACQLFPEMISSLFSFEKSIIQETTVSLQLSTIAFALAGPQMILGNFFQSIGHAKISIGLSLTRQLIFLIPGLFILPIFWGKNGVWLSMPVADTISFLLTAIVSFLFLKNYNGAVRKLPRSAILK